MTAISELAERVGGRIFGRGTRSIALDDATPTKLAEGHVTVQLSEAQAARVREIEEHGPAQR